jgi:phosphoadenosine phosphosulfate reductase
MKDRIKEYNLKLKDATAEEIITFFAKEFHGKMCFSSSLGLEDQVIAHMIASQQAAVPVFTLDTGRMFQETYSLIDRTRERYNVEIKVFFPDAADVEEMVRTRGMNLFYKSIENRQFCCKLRKIDPLKRALKGMSAWICGLRRSQSVTRQDINIVDWDDENSLVKINPLIAWELDQVWDYIRKNNVPYNPLHDKGYPSIGCLPCTRAVKPGDDIRSGRWWWEDPDKKECGLHSDSER